MKTHFILVFFLVFWTSCQNDPKVVSPKDTLIEWQKLVDKGLFAQAEKLSTPSTIQWFESIEDMTDEGASNEMTVFHDMDCVIEDNTATCNYILIEDKERLSSFITLVKVNGVWLVDIDDD